jgi:F0F1-type ATP synthase assembly protein I
MNDHSDDRSAMANAIAWSSRITSVALEMGLPGALGYWIDQKLGTWILFLVLGLVLGMTTGMIHLLRMVQHAEKKPGIRSKNDRGSRTKQQ